MLWEIADKVEGAQVVGSRSSHVFGVSIDSRQVQKGDLFVALKGEKSDGHSFISDAIRRGAVAIASQNPVTNSHVPTILIPDLRAKLGPIASLVYENPSGKMNVIGVTGTNGKTTTTHLIEFLLSNLGHSAGYIGTLGYRWNKKDRESHHTTPEAPEIQKILKAMADENVSHVVMECSSHGIEMGRLNAVQFDIVLFTNLTQDHLDFHGTMDSYRSAKKKLFTELLPASSKMNRSVIFNIDDATGRAWSGEFAGLTYSMQDPQATVHAQDVKLHGTGIEATIVVNGEPVRFASELVGAHNLSNFLAAFSVGHALGLSPEALNRAFKGFSGVPGRLERIKNSRGIHAFVDYAHTDDALFNVLKALLPLKTRRLILVFGCGGDRDKKKRPKMAKVGSENSDVLIVTSDNPRTEKPEDIVADIVPGVSPSMKSVSAQSLNENSIGVGTTIVDREIAIHTALSIAKDGDLVLIAGKGHETYQEINGIRYPFDDRVVAKNFFEGKTN